MPARVLLSLLFLGLAAPPVGAADGWQWPVRGAVVGAFDYRSAHPFAGGQHRGIDIAAPAGTRVRAACAGPVTFAGTAGSAGRTVTVRCGGVIATYLHLGAISVRAGERVAAGDLLGRVGASGRPRLRSAHLHLGARRAASRWGYLNPLALLGDGGGPPEVGPLPPPPWERPLPVRAPRGLGRAPVPVPSPAPVPAWRSPPAVAPSPPASVPWPVWAGAALLALAVPLPALRWRRVRRARRERAALVAGRTATRG